MYICNYNNKYIINHHHHHSVYTSTIQLKISGDRTVYIMEVKSYINGITKQSSSHPSHCIQVSKRIEYKSTSLELLLCYSPFLKESSYQNIRVIVPVTKKESIPVSIPHHIISFTDFMMQKKLITCSKNKDFLYRTKKYTAQFGVDNVDTQVQEIWNVEVLVSDIFFIKPAKLYNSSESNRHSAAFQLNT
tara:strand:- start:151 stop:720 length:570 start_codon:yes stop_codon:yes gene_type:complete